MRPCAPQGDTHLKNGVGSVLSDLYQNNSNKFKNLAKATLGSFVACSSTNRSKVNHAMLLAEALLTYQDRQALISGTLSAHEAAAKFTSLDKWITRATAAMQNAAETNRRKANVLGVGNIVSKKEHLNFVRGFIPDWDSIKGDPAYAPRKNQTLREWIEVKESEIKANLQTAKSRK
jgi:hypothetical protein